MAVRKILKFPDRSSRTPLVVRNIDSQVNDLVGDISKPCTRARRRLAAPVE
jgi:hypothetical protein